nr:immunoglobulin heavy chain junction region [Macaca mulatta]
CARGSYGYDYW